VHYTLEDLIDPFPYFDQQIGFVAPVETFTALASSMSGRVCTLGGVNPDYNPGNIKDMVFNVANEGSQMSFCGSPNLPYLVWASTNLIDWTVAGTVRQPTSGNFQFRDARSHGPMKFYDVQLP